MIFDFRLTIFDCYAFFQSKIKNQKSKILKPMSLLAHKPISLTCFVLFALLMCLAAYGSEKYAGEFLSLGAGARPLGMGGSFVLSDWKNV